MTRRLTISLIVALTVSGCLVSRADDIPSRLNTPGSTITVTQPDGLQRRLERTGNQATETPETVDESTTAPSENTEVVEPRRPVSTAGYRVQVFSDNNQRTAKNEARSKQSQLREAFPEWTTYVVYNSPFWRLRVGDFRSHGEADAAANKIRSRFPAFAREVRVVKDRINAN